ncbi:MAG: universal stress protein [Acidobacteria bacterium]|nr:MAG: universal stress protein [Acidobacteriota bacterium]REK01409.1 MAG: universal stress protein [Acidobacteriota bacterium]REK14365.1 MAG: universal stress protein [Acidobacteriota bacterium]REK45080.1 MAG: universal stress protein [Acidobacteriota bacterium]
MKAILATDGTSESNAAVEMIESLKFNDGDELLLITVIDMAVPMAFDAYAGYLPNTKEIEKVARENAEKVLTETKVAIDEHFSDPGVTVSTEILIGSPESRIVEKAEEFEADLLIVGSHGYNRWERLLLGSVSDSVVHHAPCSVLVVRNEPSNI